MDGWMVMMDRRIDPRAKIAERHKENTEIE